MKTLHHILYRLMAALIAVLTLACTSEIELDQPYYEPKIVVDGYIETGQFAHVYLTWSSPFLTEYDSASIRATFINNATLTLTTATGDSEVMTLFRNNAFFPPFVYRTTRLKGEEGGTYTLTVNYKGKQVTATTTLPAVPTLGDLIMEPVSDTTGYLLAEVQAAATQPTYLFVQTKSQLAKDNYHPSRIPVMLLEPSDPPIMKRLSVFRSPATNLHLLDTLSTFYEDWPFQLFALEDTVMVKIGAIDETSFDILKSLFVDQAIQNNPFAFNTAGIVTNIQGGIGRWTGIATAPERLYIGHQ